MPTALAPVTHAPPLLWAAARALIVTIFNLFGAPSDIAAQHTHVEKERRLILKWLRAGEALMRQLLLIEAAHYAKPNTRPLLRAPRKRTRRLMGFEADKPEAWRVSFRCLQTLPRARKKRPRGPKRRFYSAWPLAERAEAMLRVFNDPAPFARRLARRLHATPHRAAALTRHPENLPHVLAEAEFALLREHTGLARNRIDSG